MAIAALVLLHLSLLLCQCVCIIEQRKQRDFDDALVWFYAGMIFLCLNLAALSATN